MIIILNDNGMSISSNVGGISSYLSRISINTRYLKIKVSFDKDNTILRCGRKLKYSSLLYYIRNVGKIILFSSFTSTSENERIA